MPVEPWLCGFLLSATAILRKDEFQGVAAEACSSQIVSERRSHPFAVASGFSVLKQPLLKLARREVRTNIRERRILSPAPDLRPRNPEQAMTWALGYTDMKTVRLSAATARLSASRSGPMRSLADDTVAMVRMRSVILAAVFPLLISHRFKTS